MRTLLTFFVLAHTLAAADSPAFEWREYLASEQSIEIITLNGNIRVEPSSGPLAEVAAYKTGSRPDPSTVPTEAVWHEGGVVICAMFPSPDGAPPNVCGPNASLNVQLVNSDLKVSFVVRVPAGVTVRCRTVNGSIDAQAPENPINASTVNGQVVLTAGTDARANTVNGSIVASLGNPSWNGRREFRTVNGSVDVQLDPAASVEVRGELVLGLLATDFPLEVHHGLVGSWMRGVLGTGGRELRLSTVNGSIHLRRAPE